MKSTLHIAVILGLMLNIAVDAQTVIVPHPVDNTCNPLRISFTYTTSISPVSTVLWDFGNGTTSNLPFPGSVTFSPGRYTVTLVLNGTDTTRINVGRPDGQFTYQRSADYGSYTIIFQGFVGNNAASSRYIYNWTSPDTMLNQSFLIHQYGDVGFYPVKLIIRDSIGGCTDTVAHLINVIDTLSIPNVFTPNNDGINDEFRIASNGKDVLSFKVFTRTGLLIYAQEASVLIWDGRLASGDKALPGIYFYIIETINSQHPFKKTGFFYLFL
jgi:gliding motility-associated-like protein